MPPKKDDRDTLINEESHRQSRQHETDDDSFFFLQLKSVHRGEEGNLGNQRYGVKAAEHEGGSYDRMYSYLPCLLRLYRRPTGILSIRGKIRRQCRSKQ